MAKLGNIGSDMLELAQEKLVLADSGRNVGSLPKCQDILALSLALAQTFGGGGRQDYLLNALAVAPRLCYMAWIGFEYGYECAKARHGLGTFASGVG